jgi:hypothetical protein
MSDRSGHDNIPWIEGHPEFSKLVGQPDNHINRITQNIFSFSESGGLVINPLEIRVPIR